MNPNYGLDIMELPDGPHEAAIISIKGFVLASLQGKPSGRGIVITAMTNAGVRFSYASRVKTDFLDFIKQFLPSVGITDLSRNSVVSCFDHELRLAGRKWSFSKSQSRIKLLGDQIQ